MFSLRPLAGAILTSALLTGYVVSPAAASVQETATVSQAAARPGNGKVIYNRISGGEGILKIKNGTAKDGVVTLVRGKSKAFSLYVRAKSTASFKQVDDGNYVVYFTTGYRFSTSKRRFTKSASYQRFTGRLKFTTTATSSTVWTLTLNPVKGGNARTTGVNPKDFPA
ncbi:hypothetical protein [Herbidospora daliensis]|uniref:hypothetical protein n=1 Tax=Herbidospora daliensis TaxID=295585 RepID=UPI000781824A|nr:hypothetical protein [Herbidospora daliensis]